MREEAKLPYLNLLLHCLVTSPLPEVPASALLQGPWSVFATRHEYLQAALPVARIRPVRRAHRCRLQPRLRLLLLSHAPKAKRVQTKKPAWLNALHCNAKTARPRMRQLLLCPLPYQNPMHRKTTSPSIRMHRPLGLLALPSPSRRLGEGTHRLRSRSRTCVLYLGGAAASLVQTHGVRHQACRSLALSMENNTASCTVTALRSA